MDHYLISAEDLATGVERVLRSSGGALITVPPAVDYTQYTEQSSDFQALKAADTLRFIGWAVRESAGTPAVATFHFRHGDVNGDDLVAPIELAANQSTRDWWWPGIAVPRGIFVDFDAGTIDLTLFWLVID